jgi:predicted RNA binding protein YcfA (HicA-like mRNA interferase family)
MPRLTPVKPHDLCRVLRKNGFQILPGRGKGSHAWAEHTTDPTRATNIPDHEIKPGLLAAILAQARKKREEYHRLLRGK